MINYSPSVADLINIAEDWSELPFSLQTEVEAESIALFPTMIVDEIEDLVDALIGPGLADADDVETLWITIVSGTTANISTISKILNHATSTGTSTTISNINTAVNAVYGTVVLDQIASDALSKINSALLTYNSKFSSIGQVIGVSAATQIKDDLDDAVANLNTLIALL